MEFKPIKTRKLLPPKDNLFEVLDESLIDVQEKDIVLITSKVVSIHEGRCRRVGDVNKKELVESEADFIFDSHKEEYPPRTIKHHAFISSAGIDESNGDGYYILLPKDPFASAKMFWEYIREKHKVKEVGVIITDSHSLPFRYGAMSVALSFWGFEPIDRHKGKKDLFEREIKYSSTNLVDALAAGATLVCGETNESTPVISVREVPHIKFTESDMRDKFLVPLKEDLYYVLFKDFFKK